MCNLNVARDIRRIANIDMMVVDFDMQKMKYNLS